MEDAEAAYLSQWSESSSLKELEMREVWCLFIGLLKIESYLKNLYKLNMYYNLLQNNVNKTKSKKKKHASKSASNLVSFVLWKGFLFIYLFFCGSVWVGVLVIVVLRKFWFFVCLEKHTVGEERHFSKVLQRQVSARKGRQRRS